MNVIDRAVSFFDPEAGMRRARSREMLSRVETIGFRREGARTGTNRAPTSQVLDHPDSGSNHSDRLQIMREARGLEENCGVTKSILRKFRTHAVGRLQYIARTSDEKNNKLINDYVERWMKVADLTGRHHFRTLAGLGVTSMKRDGDIGFIVSEAERTPLEQALKVSPIRLQAIEADRIGSTISIYNGHANKPFRKLGKTEQDFSGVIVDAKGRPKRYRIFHRLPLGSNMIPAIEVEAANFLHLFDPTRLDSYRGFSAFDAAINDIKDAAELLGMEKIALKYLCSRSGLVKNATGEAPDDVLLDTDHADYNADAARLKTVTPGAIEYLQEGEDFVPLNFDRPSNTFAGFIETLMRRTGLSLNLPFGFVYSWASQGTAVRMEAAQATREIEQTQLVWEERMGDPLVARVIARGMQIGDLPTIPDFDRGEWRYPARITADVGRESKALIEENLSGLISKTQIAAERGEDRGLVRSFIRSETLELIEDAKAIVAASGGEVDLKLALFMLEKRSPNAPMEPPEPAEKPSSSDE